MSAMTWECSLNGVQPVYAIDMASPSLQAQYALWEKHSSRSGSVNVVKWQGPGDVLRQSGSKAGLSSKASEMPSVARMTSDAGSVLVYCQPIESYSALSMTYAVSAYSPCPSTSPLLRNPSPQTA